MVTTVPTEMALGAAGKWGGAAPRDSVASVSKTLFSSFDLWHLSRERASESSIRTWSGTTSTLSSLYYFDRGAQAAT